MRAISTAICIALLTACAQSQPLNDSPSDISLRGQITRTVTSDDAPQALVRLDEPHPELGPSAWVLILDSTRVEREGVQIDATTLRTGERVSVLVDGSGWGDSLPPSVTGKRIVVLSD